MKENHFVSSIVQEVKNKIQNLNSPQFGSFGEFIFAKSVTDVLHESIEKVHRDGVDFNFRCVNIDVGAKRKLNAKYTSNEKIAGKDVFVVFYQDCCKINYPSNFESVLDWDSIVSAFEEWSSSRIIKIPSQAKQSYTKDYAEIKSHIVKYFADKKIDARVLYRTVSRKFGLGESPDNLLPKKSALSSVSIYIDFNDFKRIASNIRFIIAFPDNQHNDIPIQKTVSLKSGKKDLNKIDLTQIVPNKHRCYFESIEELTSCFFKRYV
jgi:hypothetical protein